MTRPGTELPPPGPLMRAFSSLAALLLVVVAAAAPAAEMTINRQRQSLIISGAVSSPAHEDILAATAARQFPATDTTLTVTVTGGLPTTWSLLTDQTLRVLAHSYVATAVVNPAGIHIRGTTMQSQSLQVALTRLKQYLPPGMKLTTQIVPIAGEQSLAAMCQQLFNAAFAERELEFTAGSVQLSSSGFGFLDTLAELAYDCPAARLTVIGSGDSNGRASADGLQRAQAVVDYLVSRGVDAGRLSARSSSRETDRKIRFQLQLWKQAK